MSVLAHSKSLLSTFVATAAAFFILATPVRPAHAGMYAPIWSGVYVGVHGGANWSDVDFSNIGSAESSAFVGGGHVGLNVPIGNIIAGIEADLDVDNTSFTYWGGGAVGHMDADWGASLRGRLGMMAGPVLLYATAGVAWKDVSIVETSWNGASASSSTTLTGVVYGIGAETYVLPNLSLRLEALQYDYGSEDLSLAGAASAVQEIDPSDTVVRAGITFHLN